MPSVDIPCIDEDVAEMTFESFEIELPYQQSNKYKWLRYCIQDMVAVNIVVELYIVIQTEKKNRTCEKRMRPVGARRQCHYLESI